MSDWLVFLTLHQTTIWHMYFVKESESNNTACLTAWESFEMEYAETAVAHYDDWRLEAYELPTSLGAHRIDR